MSNLNVLDLMMCISLFQFQLWTVILITWTILDYSIFDFKK